MARWLLVPALALATLAAGCEAPGPADLESATAELRDDRPRYTAASPEVLGLYKANPGERCFDTSSDWCEQIVVRRTGGKVEVSFGYDAFTPFGIVAEAWEEDEGVLVFVIDGGPWSTPCDDPGCHDMLKISGVIYPVRDGERWVPQLKAYYTMEFPFPDAEDPSMPSGEQRAVVRLRKQAP